MVVPPALIAGHRTLTTDGVGAARHLGGLHRVVFVGANLGSEDD